MWSLTDQGSMIELVRNPWKFLAAGTTASWFEFPSTYAAGTKFFAFKSIKSSSVFTPLYIWQCHGFENPGYPNTKLESPTPSSSLVHCLSLPKTEGLPGLPLSFWAATSVPALLVKWNGKWADSYPLPSWAPQTMLQQSCGSTENSPPPQNDAWLQVSDLYHSS